MTSGTAFGFAVVRRIDVCNLYAHRATRERLKAGLMPPFEEFDDHGSNFPPLFGVYPDYQAPIVRLKPGTRVAELATARWGMPSPKQALEGKKTDPGVTNVRNTKSGHWRRWLSVENRCLVPFTSFSEPEP
jgi:putative SOS response-associated peptidase YedK